MFALRCTRVFFLGRRRRHDPEVGIAGLAPTSRAIERVAVADAAADTGHVGVSGGGKQDHHYRRENDGRRKTCDGFLMQSRFGTVQG